MKPYVRIPAIALVLIIASCVICRAEKIYCKDGRTVNAEILYRTNGSFWLKQEPGAVGVSEKAIGMIENDDGSLSRYGYSMWLEATQRLIAQGDYQGAAKMCTILLNSFPDNSDVRCLRGLLSQKNGDTEQAVKDYTAMIKAGNADARIYNNLGTIYAGRQRLDEALALFEEAVTRDPGSIEAHNNLADLLLKSADYERAVHEFALVTGKEPGNLAAVYNLGLAYFNCGNYPKAREQWEKVLAAKPEDAGARKALGLLKGK